MKKWFGLQKRDLSKTPGTYSGSNGGDNNHLNSQVFLLMRNGTYDLKWVPKWMAMLKIQMRREKVE